MATRWLWVSVRALSPRRYFLGFWVWQMLWVYIVSTPVIFINASSSSAAGTPLGAADFVGWGIFVAGFLLQWWADVVKHRFRQVRGRQQREGRGSQGMLASLSRGLGPHSGLALVLVSVLAGHPRL